MPSTRRRRTGPLTLAAVALAALLAGAATACGPSDDKAGPAPSSASASTGLLDGLKLPDGLPTSIQQLKDWDWNDWTDWAKDAAQKAFKNPIVQDLWTPERMTKAEPLDATIKDSFTAADPDQGVTDPVPAPVQAREAGTPYDRTAAPVGKIFLDGPEGAAVCSGTVVKDPAHPGKSNLVWTAGHCVHAGAAGGWYRNIEFVPAYNSDGQHLTSQSQVTKDEIAPYGEWWAEWAQTSAQWIEGGSETGNTASTYDYAVLKVTNLQDPGKSLEEAVGSAVPVWFNSQRSSIASTTAWGYPAAEPYDGQIMFSCADRPTRLSLNSTAPTMLRIGCTMTGGSSGGGWLARNASGDTALVSNTSIGPTDNTWLAGPYLGDVAAGVFNAISQKYAND